ncbi:hypothetical protein Scep_028197 [Stephania cephalantha]|uniref:Uncharacterized protein n=1 Tax=Stephania cephalantha TaxID=152367 RepID=A0AAP0HN86_9MAGN
MGLKNECSNFLQVRFSVKARKNIKDSKILVKVFNFKSLIFVVILLYIIVLGSR